ncbi:MAG: capsular polysaccharide synthesis protein [Treponema sp.]|nr:capsular polysaccharide synthesis protein [Treponema sp.]
MGIKTIARAMLPKELVSLYKNIKYNRNKILRTLQKNHAGIIDSFREKKNIVPPPPPDKPYIVWTCWWQGERNMPEVVKMCYNQLNKNANGHRVIVITKENYKEYISLPEYILEKVEKKMITITHLSDILRACLLYTYGGLWIDSTVFTTSPLPEFTPETELYSLRRLNDANYVSRSRWTAFLFYANKGNLLFEYLMTIFFEYWKTNNTMIDYFLIDDSIAIAYNEIADVARMIEHIPHSNRYVHWLCANLNNEFNAKDYNELTGGACFHKLSYKEKYCESVNGKLTYYGYIARENKGEPCPVP